MQNRQDTSSFGTSTTRKLHLVSAVPMTPCCGMECRFFWFVVLAVVSARYGRFIQDFDPG